MNSTTFAAFADEITKLAAPFEATPSSCTTTISAEDYRPSTLRGRTKKAGSRLRKAMTFVENGKLLNMMHGDEVVGSIYHRAPGVIQGAKINEKYRGLGLGRKLYGEAARRAPLENGRVSLRSDGSVSGEASRLWEGMIRRPAKGAQVGTHPATSPATTPLRSGAQTPGRKWDLDKMDAMKLDGTPSSGMYAMSLPAKAAIKTSAHERMGHEGWKQTAKDVPAVVLGTGLGYGVGKTVSEEIGKRLALKGKKPGWLKHAPLASAMASSLASYSLGRSRKAMAARREDARARVKKSGAEGDLRRLGGAAIGATAGMLLPWVPPALGMVQGIPSSGATIGGAIIGATLGGLAGHALSADDNRRTAARKARERLARESR